MSKKVRIKKEKLENVKNELAMDENISIVNDSIEKVEVDNDIKPTETIESNDNVEIVSVETNAVDNDEVSLKTDANEVDVKNDEVLHEDESKAIKASSEQKKVLSSRFTSFWNGHTSGWE